jgi:hypothetical protein
VTKRIDDKKGWRRVLTSGVPSGSSKSSGTSLFALFPVLPPGGDGCALYSVMARPDPDSDSVAGGVCGRPLRRTAVPFGCGVSVSGTAIVSRRSGLETRRELEARDSEGGLKGEQVTLPRL